MRDPIHPDETLREDLDALGMELWSKVGDEMIRRRRGFRYRRPGCRR